MHLHSHTVQDTANLGEYSLSVFQKTRLQKSLHPEKDQRHRHEDYRGGSRSGKSAFSVVIRLHTEGLSQWEIWTTC